MKTEMKGSSTKGTAASWPITFTSKDHDPVEFDSFKGSMHTLY